MSVLASAHPETAVENSVPPVPLTLEGSSVLHQMSRLRWSAWKQLGQAEQKEIAAEAASLLEEMGGKTAVFSLLGHKGDLLFLHFRDSFDELNQAELQLARLRLSDYLEPTTSYLSVVELGLYESSLKTYDTLSERGLAPHSAEWDAEIQAVIDRQREAKNWYQLPMAERQRQMHEHGLIGRRYAGTVKQIITGSIGFDDWEWGVDLFADDPLVFKKLIYEMRFDEVSALYALFGTFYVALRCTTGQLLNLLITK